MELPLTTAGLLNQNLINLFVLKFFSNTFLFLSFLLFVSCENDIKTVQSLTVSENGPSETIKGGEILYSDSAKLLVKITSPQIDRFQGKKNYLEMPIGVKVEFYDKDKKVKTKLTANYAIRYEDQGKMEAKNDVVVINEKGEKLNTEHLIWDERKQLIYTEDFVKITTADEVILGDGLEANSDFSQYKIKNIKGTININDDAKKND